jgi:cytochrome c551/c552
MIGASVGDLLNVVTEYRQVSDQANESGNTVVSTCGNSIDQILAETDRAEQQCIAAIDRMTQASRAATTRLASALYQGQNAETARAAGADMDAKCQQAMADMTEHFANFRTNINALGASLNDTATAFDGYAKAAAESGQSMAEGMGRQAEAIEAAMSGMSYG